MVKKKIVLADEDELYLTNLSNYFMEKAPQLELSLFTDKNLLKEFLKKKGKADILVIDESFADAELESMGKEMTRIKLSTSMVSAYGFEPVKKYQKSEMLLNEIMLKYAEQTGIVEAVQGKSNTKIVSFYSSAGGTGKTTLALSLAAATAASGFRTLYLNMEEIESVKAIFQETAGNLSEVFLALKTKGMDAGIKLAASVGMDMVGGFWYLSGLESMTEYEELDKEDIHKLFTSIRGLAEYDLIVIDTSSGMSPKVNQILEDSDLIFVPVVSNEGAVAKMIRYLEEVEIHIEYREIFSKMNLIVNRTNVSGSYGKELQQSGLMDRMPCCCAVASSPVFTKRMDIIRSGNALRQTMEPLMQMIKLL